MLENEMERINKQKIYDMNHYLNDKTIYEWKQNFINGLFQEESYWIKEEKRKSGTYIIKCEESDNGAYLKHDIVITNSGIWRAVENQVAIYRDLLDEDEIRSICRLIITNAIYKYKIKDDTRQGEEINRLCGYILTCIKTEINNYIKDWTESKRDRTNEEENIFSPEMLESAYQLLEDEEGNKIELISTIATEQNYTYCNLDDEYVKTDTLQAIEKAIEDELTDYEKDIFNILAISNNNNADAGRLLKEIDIKQGNKLRSSDDAYRVHIKRQKDKIIKKINDNVDIGKVARLNKQKELKQEIQEFLKGDTTNIKVIEYVNDNLDKDYMLDILYDNLDDEYRKYLIQNFISNYNEDKLFKPMTRKICSKTLSELWKYIKVLDFKIEGANIKKSKIKATQPAPVIPEFNIDTNTYIYIREDKYNDEYKKKYAKKGIEIDIQGEKIIYNEKYYLVYINKAEDRMDWKKARKTKYNTINLYGNIF